MTKASEPAAVWEAWMDNPLAVDQTEGAEITEPDTYHMQIRSGDMWMPFSNPRTDRDEVTTIQAFHLNKHPDEPGIRVFTRRVIWILDEVPGDGTGQTPREEILARNKEIEQRRNAEQTQQPDE